ncbi:MAG: hypothetical protein HF981_24135 [Desulfobacteraceae bacterium]|nr:hypothetical protein [Desulfobacteraceae bacterium]MBC2753506.1 hypothetical protein [Desulfobacteraceae bacterium]
MHDHDGRAWITLDKKEITNMVHIWKWLELHKKEINELKLQYKNAPDYDEGRFRKMAEEELENKGIFMQSHLGGAMHEYQNLSIKDILSSKNHVIRAICMLDRRTGKRTLKEIDISNEHPLVCTTYIFRCEAEGIIK